jgi:hypothetical protein
MNGPTLQSICTFAVCELRYGFDFPIPLHRNGPTLQAKGTGSLNAIHQLRKKCFMYMMQDWGSNTHAFLGLHFWGCIFGDACILGPGNPCPIIQHLK